MKLKVCVPLSDGTSVFDGHMGDAPSFGIYELRENGYTLLEERKNVPFKEKGHGNRKKMEHILEVVGDCDLFIGSVLSPNFLNLRDNTDVQPVVSKLGDISKTLEALRMHWNDVSQLVEERRSGKRPRKIPVFSSNEMKMIE